MPWEGSGDRPGKQQAAKRSLCNQFLIFPRKSCAFFFFCFFCYLFLITSLRMGWESKSNVAKHVQRRVCVRLRSKTWTVGVYYKGWFKMQCESASRCSRCWPDGGREEAFEWQKWNIDKTRGHKHTARLKMWPDGWHLISQCLLVSSFFFRGGRLSPADLHSWRLYPETPRASVKPPPPCRRHTHNPPPPRAGLECEKKNQSFTEP